MRIGIAADHGGFPLKEELVVRLKSAGHEVVDFGCFTAEPCDYPSHDTVGHTEPQRLPVPSSTNSPTLLDKVPASLMVTPCA